MKFKKIGFIFSSLIMAASLIAPCLLITTPNNLENLNSIEKQNAKVGNTNVLSKIELLGYENREVDSMKNDELIKIMFDYGVENPPSKLPPVEPGESGWFPPIYFEEENIIFKNNIISRSASTGEIKFVVGLTMYELNGTFYNDKTKPKYFPETTLSGFKKEFPTSGNFNKDITISGELTKLRPSDISEVQIKGLVFDNLKNYPKDFDYNKNIILEKTIANNIEGSIITDVYLDNFLYLSPEGELVISNEKTLFGNMNFIGFNNKYNETTLTNINIYLPPPNDEDPIPKIASEVTDEFFIGTSTKQGFLDSEYPKMIINKPDNFVFFKNGKIIKRVNDNVKGLITLTIGLNYYINSEGKVVGPTLEYHEIGILTFLCNKIIIPTSLNSFSLKSDIFSKYGYSDINDIVDIMGGNGKKLLWGFVYFALINSSIIENVPSILAPNPSLYDKQNETFLLNSQEDFDVVVPTEKIKLNIVNIDQINSTIIFNFELFDYFDENGVTISNSVPLKSQDIEIFCPSNYTPTTISSNINVSDDEQYSSKFLTEVNNNDFKNIILTKGFLDESTKDLVKKGSITIHNIIIKDVLFFQKEGEVNLTISLNKYYNLNGILINSSEISFGKIIIKGFMKRIPTTIKKEYMFDEADNIGIASDFLGEKAKVFIFNNLVENKLVNINDPNGSGQKVSTVIENLNFTEISYSNLIGQIIYNVNFKNNYLDHNGNLIILNSGEEILSPTFVVKLTGFNRIEPTQVLLSYNVNKPSISPSDFSIEDVKTIIKNKMIIGSRPENIAIEIPNENIISNNNLGNISAVVILRNYYDNDGIFDNKNELTFRVSLINFKSLFPTKVLTTFDVEELNQFCEEYDRPGFAELKKLIASKAILNAPENFTYENIIIVEDKIIYSNLTGQITLKVKLNKFTNSDGIIIESNTEFPTVLMSITGFNKVGQTSFPNNIIVSPPLNEKTPSEILVSDIQKLIFEKVLNKPLDFTEDNIEVAIDDINNPDGFLTANAKLNKFYNKNGILETFLPNDPNNSFWSVNVFIDGLSISKETIVLENYNPNLPNILPSNLDIPTIKSILASPIKGLILNKPTNAKIENIIIKKIDNISGILIFDFDLTSYYNNIGIFINKRKTYTVIFDNLATTKPTTVAPSFNALGLKNILPFDFSEDEFLKLIFKNKDKIFGNLPSNFSLGNMKIKAGTYKPNNTFAKIDATIESNNFYDNSGENIKIWTTIGNISINGFDIQNKTIINTYSNISNLSDGFGLQSASQAMTNVSSIKKAIVDIAIENKPIGFNNNDINIIGSMIPSSDDTKLTITITLNKYFNDLGVLVVKEEEDVNVFPETTLELVGFITGKNTKISSIYEVKDEFFANKNPSELTEKEIKEIIIKNMIGNKPANFSVENIIFNFDKIIKNNIDGSITVNEVNLNMYYDENAQIQNKLKNFGSITISGFYKNQLTSINNVIDVSNDFLNKQPIQITDLDLKNILFKNIKNMPKNFSIDNISITNIIRNNLLGKITGFISLNSFFDNAGEYQTSGFIPVNFVIDNLLKTSQTIISDEIDVSLNSITRNQTVAEWTKGLKEQELKNEIIKYIIPSFSNLPSDANVEIIGDVKLDNKNGIISFLINVSKYYDAEGILKTSNFAPNKIILYNFVKMSPTYLTSVAIDLLKENKLPTELTEDYIKQIVSKEIMNKPKDFTDANILIKNIKRDNKTGTLTFELSLNNFIDSEYNYSNKGFPPTIITLFNLNSLKETTIGNRFTADYTIKNYLPSLLSKKDIIDFIFNEIKNKPNNFTYGNIQIYNLKPDNMNGMITFELILTKYNNSEGVETSGNFIPVIITIDGFRKPEVPTGTTIIPNFFTVDKIGNIPLSSVLATNEEILPIEVIRKIIFDKIKAFVISNNGSTSSPNVPFDFKIDDIKIEAKPKRNNLIGHVIVDMKVKNYYLNGDLKTNFSNFSTTIYGFQKVKPTKIKPHYTAIGYSNVEANSSSITIEMLKELIFNGINSDKESNISDLELFNDKPFNINDLEIVKNSLTPDTDKGAINLQIILKKYINIDGNFSNEPKIYDINLFGFKVNVSENQTMLRSSNADKDGWFQGLRGTMITEVTEEQIKELIFDNLANKPTAFSLINITIVDSIADLKYGLLTVNFSLDFYLNEAGLPIEDKENPKELQIKLNGFEKELNYDKEAEVKNLIIIGSTVSAFIIIVLTILFYLIYNKFYRKRG